MADEQFNGEKLTITKVELGLVAALALVVLTFVLLGVNGLVVLGVLLTAAMLVLITLLTSGKTPKIFGGD